VTKTARYRIYLSGTVVIRCSTITPLAHSMPGAGFVHQINRATLVVCALKPSFHLPGVHHDRMRALVVAAVD
jgi:hypothetical protein